MRFSLKNDNLGLKMKVLKFFGIQPNYDACFMLISKKKDSPELIRSKYFENFLASPPLAESGPQFGGRQCRLDTKLVSPTGVLEFTVPTRILQDKWLVFHSKDSKLSLAPLNLIDF